MLVWARYVIEKTEVRNKQTNASPGEGKQEEQHKLLQELVVSKERAIAWRKLEFDLQLRKLELEIVANQNMQLGQQDFVLWKAKACPWEGTQGDRV